VFVLHVITALNVGGAELMLKRLVESRWRDSNIRHVVISLMDVGPIGQQLQAQNIEVHALGMHGFRDIPRILFSLRRLIGTLRPDIVQTWMYHADLLGGLAARWAGIRTVIWGIRQTDITKGGPRTTVWVRRVCAFLSYVVPHTIVCVAEASKRVHIELGYCARRMRVVPNGFDFRRLQASEAEVAALRIACGWLNDEVVVGCVGGFHPFKGFDQFVHAAGKVARQFESVRFLMVGRGLRPDNVELTRWIAQTGFPERFVLLGERSDVPACLAAMDVFCLSSRTEGFPNVVGEAMAMGLPCVVTDVGDAAMLLAGAGVVVPKEDAPALAQGMARLLRLSVEERRTLGRAARARIKNEFSMEQCTQRFEAVYADVLMFQAWLQSK